MLTLGIDGEKSLVFMHDAADTLRKAMSRAKWKTLQDQTHQVSHKTRRKRHHRLIAAAAIGKRICQVAE